MPSSPRSVVGLEIHVNLPATPTYSVAIKSDGSPRPGADPGQQPRPDLTFILQPKDSTKGA